MAADSFRKPCNPLGMAKDMGGAGEYPNLGFPKGHPPQKAGSGLPREKIIAAHIGHAVGGNICICSNHGNSQCRKLVDFLCNAGGVVGGNHQPMDVF